MTHTAVLSRNFSCVLCRQSGGKGMSHHNLNTDRVTAAAPGPAACLILLSPVHCVVGLNSYRFTISVAEVLISFLAEVLIPLLAEVFISLVVH